MKFKIFSMYDIFHLFCLKFNLTQLPVFLPSYFLLTVFCAFLTRGQFLRVGWFEDMKRGSLDCSSDLAWLEEARLVLNNFSLLMLVLLFLSLMLIFLILLSLLLLMLMFMMMLTLMLMLKLPRAWWRRRPAHRAGARPFIVVPAWPARKS